MKFSWIQASSKLDVPRGWSLRDSGCFVQNWVFFFAKQNGHLYRIRRSIRPNDLVVRFCPIENHGLKIVRFDDH